jgi:diguanylate cyclase (GGDEF)-like protein
VPLSNLLDAGDEPEANQERSSAIHLPRQLSDAELSLFRAGGRTRRVTAGETIFRKGELGLSMFVIESGQIRIEFADDFVPALIGEREFFGELAMFIGDHERIAGAIAVTDSQLYEIDHASFEKLLASEPLLLARFMRRSFTYLVANEQKLITNLRRRNEDLVSTLHSLRQAQTALANANSLIRTDELTGLANRHGLYQYLATLAERRRPGTLLALFLVDLDRFKAINDRFGHPVGDRALSLVADELRRRADETELCCRLGGDEFALLVQLGHARDLDEHAADLVATVHRLRLAPPHDHVLFTVSVGACLCDERSDWSAWCRDADRALYVAKDEGGNRWYAATPAP